MFPSHDHALYANISGRINEQVARYLPYIEITNAVYDSSATNENLDTNFLYVEIQYVIKPLQVSDKISLSLPDN